MHSCVFRMYETMILFKSGSYYICATFKMMQLIKDNWCTYTLVLFVVHGAAELRLPLRAFGSFSRNGLSIMCRTVVMF